VIDALACAGFIRQRLSAGMLPKLAAAAKRAKVGRVPGMQRRQRSAEDRFVAGLADMLAGAFFDLCGQRPTLGMRYVSGTTRPRSAGRPMRKPRKPAVEAYGDFLALVADVFKIMGIRRSPIAAARMACTKFKAGGKG
jgi:hypothetical protein